MLKIYYLELNMYCMILLYYITQYFNFTANIV